MNPIVLDVECIVCNKTLQKINHVPRESLRRMGKVSNRRSRTPNWSMEEKQYLLELIKERKEVVVTKTNNGPNYYEEKDAAWKGILRELAGKFGNKFSDSSTKKVKTQWQNMKRIAREEMAANGGVLDKFTRQSVEVCHILDMVQDGVLKREAMESVEPSITTANVEVKTERDDDDMNNPGCSEMVFASNKTNQMRSSELNDSSSPGPMEIVTDAYDDTPDGSEHQPVLENDETRTNNDIPMAEASSMTEPLHENFFQKELQDYLKFSAVEKQLKLESLKDERQVIRAMRETAELNKIIAEQRLKLVLWMKKQHMCETMYSGEPGSGAGRGGGGGGAIREAGGSFGKMEAAREDEYFYKKQREQLSNIKSHLTKEIDFHQEQIKRHEDAIRRHKEQMTDFEKK